MGDNGQDDFVFTKPPEAKSEELGRDSTMELIALLHNRELSHELVKMLCEALPIEDIQEGDYNEGFNLRDELSCQIKVVRGLRREIFYPNGALRANYGVDDASRVLNASRDLLRLLQTQHDELVNYERIQAIETSFLDVVSEMPISDQEKYQESLANHLDQNSPSLG